MVLVTMVHNVNNVRKSLYVVIVTLYIAICTKTCLNGGECVGPDVCNCTGEWKGPYCQIRGYFGGILCSYSQQYVNLDVFMVYV